MAVNDEDMETMPTPTLAPPSSATPIVKNVAKRPFPDHTDEGRDHKIPKQEVTPNEIQQPPASQQPEQQEQEHQEQEQEQLLQSQQQHHLDQPPSQNTRSGIARTTNQLEWIHSKLFRALWNHQQAWPFRDPVDPIAHKIPTYFDVIKHPMDLSTVLKKLLAHEYHSSTDALADIDLIFDNCRLFNHALDPIVAMANVLQALEKKKLKSMPKNEIEQFVIPKQVGAKKSRSRGGTVVESHLRTSPRSKQTPVTTSRRKNVTTKNTAKVVKKKTPRTLNKTFSKPSVKVGGYVKVGGPVVKLNNQLRFCHSVLRGLLNKKHIDYSWALLDMVDPVALGLSHIINQPRDINSVKKKLEENKYASAAEFVCDMELIFTNFMLCHPPDHNANKMAEKLRTVFRKLVVDMPEPDKTPFQTQNTPANSTTTTTTTTNTNIDTNPDTSTNTDPDTNVNTNTYTDTNTNTNTMITSTDVTDAYAHSRPIAPLHLAHFSPTPMNHTPTQSPMPEDFSTPQTEFLSQPQSSSSSSASSSSSSDSSSGSGSGSDNDDDDEDDDDDDDDDDESALVENFELLQKSIATLQSQLLSVKKNKASAVKQAV